MVVTDVLKNETKEEVEMVLQIEMVTNFNHYITDSTFNYPYLYLSGGNITVYDVETQDVVVSDDECSLKKILAMDKYVNNCLMCGFQLDFFIV